MSQNAGITANPAGRFSTGWTSLSGSRRNPALSGNPVVDPNRDRLAALLPIKWARMAVSPFGFAAACGLQGGGRKPRSILWENLLKIATEHGTLTKKSLF